MMKIQHLFVKMSYFTTTKSYIRQMSTIEWTNGVRNLVAKLTSFNERNPKSCKRLCYRFNINNKTIGYIKPNVLEILNQHYSKYFLVNGENRVLEFVNKYDDYNSRSEIMNEILNDMRKRKLFIVLDGWRNETYDIKESFYTEKLFKAERACVSIFGFIQYSCQVNAYVKENNKYKIWLSRRSPTKPTFPGMLDIFSAGGLTSNLDLYECAVKELDEETGVNGELLKMLKPVGAITYSYETTTGIYREGEFIFDLKLPCLFTPKNNDGETQAFYLMDIESVKEAIIKDDFKPNSALITLGFLMRKGLINPNSEPNFLYILENMNAPGF